MSKALIVGCGIVGCTVARILADRGWTVRIVDRRDHIGGNLYDYRDEHGILVQQYGPHIFHTNSERVFEFVNRYSRWNKFNLVCGAVIDGICTPTAFNLKTIDLFFDKAKAEEIKQHIRERFPGRESATVVELLDCDDAVIRDYAQFLFDKDYSLYTAKQWGISPSEIDKSVLKRVPIRFTYEEAYFKDKYQVMPENGYTSFIRNLIDHPAISVTLNYEAMEHITIRDNAVYLDGKKADYPVVYTGPLDELFHYEYGRLPYRSLRFEWIYRDAESYQDLPVVAYPQAEKFTRITEYKKLPVQDVRGTTCAVEYPVPYEADADTSVEPYYPVLTEASKKAYSTYADAAAKVSGLYCAGRLADFRYYNMDQAPADASNKEHTHDGYVAGIRAFIR